MSDGSPIRLVYFGSGAFGLPTLRRLVEHHDVALIVSQPDRPAGRKRTRTPTPTASFANDRGIEQFKPERPNEVEAIERIRDASADAFVIIAYGHKLGPALLGETFAINLHASLLPKYRGAAPINWAMINGESETGVSVIGLAQTMDAGPIYAKRITPIDPAETAGELHDRLADMGPDAVLETLDRHRAGTLEPVEQDLSEVTKAPKLIKADGTVRFDQPARAVRCRVHGLTPWPGCTVVLDGEPLKLLRVQDVDAGEREAAPGTLRDDLTVACDPGVLRLNEVQPPGKRAMSFEAYVRGHAVHSGARMEPS